MPETRLHELQDPEARQAVIEAVFDLFKRWELHPVNQAELLGISDMTDLKQGGAARDDPLAFECMGHLLAIDRALLKRFPYQTTSRDRWVWQERAQLQGETPMAFMLQQGLDGIKRIRQLLES